MPDDAFTLEDLIALVNRRTGGEGGLAYLADASALSRQLGELTDQLLDYFVHQARESGASWSQIGEQLGVSKQGAQQRFAGQARPDAIPQLQELGEHLEEESLQEAPALAGGLLHKVRSAFKTQRFTAAARQVVVLAQEEARTLHHSRIGAEHLLLGLLREEGGVAASTLRSMGVTAERAREVVTGTMERVEPAPTGHMPFTSGARSALGAAMAESANLRHKYIGTEHILVGTLRQETPRWVLSELKIDVALLAQEVSRLLERP